MLLTATQLRDLHRQRPWITPYEPQAVRSAGPPSYGQGPLPSYGQGPVTYDVRVDDQLIAIGSSIHDPIDPMSKTTGRASVKPVHELPDGRRGILILPNETLQATTREAFDIPTDMVIVPTGKSTYTRHGLMLLATPFEPGWQGRAIVALHNAAHRSLWFYPDGGAFACLCYHVDGAPAYDGRYQGQGL